MVYPIRIVHNMCGRQAKKYALYKMEVWPGSPGHIRHTLARRYLFSTELYSSVSLNSKTWSTSEPLHYLMRMRSYRAKIFIEERTQKGGGSKTE